MSTRLGKARLEKSLDKKIGMRGWDSRKFIIISLTVDGPQSGAPSKLISTYTRFVER